MAAESEEQKVRRELDRDRRARDSLRHEFGELMRAQTDARPLTQQQMGGSINIVSQLQRREMMQGNRRLQRQLERSAWSTGGAVHERDRVEDAYFQAQERVRAGEERLRDLQWDSLQ